MATTTNYGWTTPDDTDLVKDGASAIRSLGTAIDSTVFTNAGNAVQKSTIDAKGDLLVGTADNTLTRLAVGTNNYVLTADSAEASGVKWAAVSSGGYTEIYNQTLSSASTATISNIASGYKHILVLGNLTVSTGGGLLYVRFNDDSTAGKHNNVGVRGNWGSSNFSDIIGTGSEQYVINDGGTSIATPFSMILTNYEATNGPLVGWLNSANYSSTNTLKYTYLLNIGFEKTSAVTSMKFYASGTVSGTLKVYGAN